MSLPKITEWLEGQSEKHESSIVRLHYSTELKQGSYTAQLDEWPLTRTTAHTVAHAAWKVMESDAGMFDGTPKYDLVLFVERDGKTEQKARHGVNPEIKKKDMEALSPMGEATVSFMRQVFAHNEVLMKILVQVVAAGEGSKLREIERLSQRSDSLERQLDAMRDEIERSKDKNHERALARAKFDGEERRIDEIVSTGLTLAPFVVNSLAKKSLIPTGDNSVLHEALRVVMDGLTPEQFDQLRHIMTPQQKVGLMELYKLVKEEAKDAQRSKKNQEH